MAQGTSNLEVYLLDKVIYGTKQNYDSSLVSYSFIGTVWQTKTFALGQRKCIFKNLCEHFIFKSLRKILPTNYKNENQLEF